MNRLILAGCFLFTATFAQAKIRLLVEDPNNLVAGRYSLTGEQASTAKQMAETTLSSLKEKDLQTALAIRYVAIDAGPLTASQQQNEPNSLRCAQARLASHGVDVPDNVQLFPIAIYDTEKHRIIHSRLYTVIELPKLRQFGRFDDYIALYIGGGSPFSNHFAK